MESVHFTEEGFKKIIDELNHMKNVERQEISKMIKEARDNGDISENVEYDAAKEAQGMLEMRISKLEGIISNAKIIDRTKIDTSKVSALTTVNVKTSKGNFKYTLVPENDVNLKEMKISLNSPIAKSLLGKKIGDKVEAIIPAGKIEMEIIEITL